MNTDTVELYKRHRPISFKQVVGQPDAIKILQEMVKNNRIPHAILFSGGSGCGKTTLARILKDKLNCGESDFTEINAADFRGIEMVREIRNRMNLSPIGGTSRIYLIDEAHQLSSQAQNAFLKMLEDTPKHVYFFLATTDPLKLIATIRTRCTEVKLKELGPASMRELLVSIAEKEGVELSDDVLDRLIDHSEGSARKALVILNQIIGVPDDDGRLNAIENSDHKSKGIELARALLNPRASWPEVAKLLKGLEEEPETIRYIVLGYASNVMLGGGKLAGRAFYIADIFQHNFYDSKRAGLVLACWAAVNPR